MSAQATTIHKNNKRFDQQIVFPVHRVPVKSLDAFSFNGISLYVFLPTLLIHTGDIETMREGI